MLFFHWLNISPLVVSQQGKLERGGEEENGRERGQRQRRAGLGATLPNKLDTCFGKTVTKPKLLASSWFGSAFVPCMSVIGPDPPAHNVATFDSIWKPPGGTPSFLLQFNCLTWRRERIWELLVCIKGVKEIPGARGEESKRRRKWDRKTEKG